MKHWRFLNMKTQPDNYQQTVPVIQHIHTSLTPSTVNFIFHSRQEEERKALESERVRYTVSFLIIFQACTVLPKIHCH